MTAVSHSFVCQQTPPRTLLQSLHHDSGTLSDASRAALVCEGWVSKSQEDSNQGCWPVKSSQQCNEFGFKEMFAFTVATTSAASKKGHRAAVSASCADDSGARIWASCFAFLMLCAEETYLSAASKLPVACNNAIWRRCWNS